jgi:hypothetical protein
MAGPDDKFVVSGAWGEIRYASRPDRSRPAEEFYLSISVIEKAQIDTLFKRLVEHGRIFNRRQFKLIEGGIFGFKTKSGVRISCYQDRRCWYLLHGFMKSGKFWPTGEVIRAKNLLIEHRGY